MEGSDHAPRIDLTARDLNTFPDGCLVCRAELRGVRRPAAVSGLEFVFECGTVYRREEDAVEVSHRGDCCNALELALRKTRIIGRNAELAQTSEERIARDAVTPIASHAGRG